MRIESGTVIEAARLAFDMDGTMIDSTRLIEKAWVHWAKRHDLAVSEILQACHGRRAIDTISRFSIPSMNIEAEAAQVADFVDTRLDELKPIPGAMELLQSLLPGDWGLVTSAQRSIAERWMRHRLPYPRCVHRRWRRDRRKARSEPLYRGRPGARLPNRRNGGLRGFGGRSHLGGNVWSSCDRRWQALRRLRRLAAGLRRRPFCQGSHTHRVRRLRVLGQRIRPKFCGGVARRSMGISEKCWAHSEATLKTLR